MKWFGLISRYSFGILRVVKGKENWNPNKAHGWVRMLWVLSWGSGGVILSTSRWLRLSLLVAQDLYTYAYTNRLLSLKETRHIVPSK